MRKTRNINFVLIGARATGKTVYLASLFLNEKSVTSQDGHTIEYLKPLADSLLGGGYPQATAGTLHELKFNYRDKDVSCHVQIDDVDGYFVETMHKEDENTQKQRDRLIKNIKHSEGIIFFFPFEEIFNEESIKNFNYEIDTIISQLTSMYSKHNHIPIPAVIAVAKWDKSPHFKSEDEDKKALEYINSNQFLKLAKEKIEHNFPNLLIVPISAIGQDIGKMEPYNLRKPLRFFIDETYRLWEKKIKSFKNKKDSLKFLSRIHFDMTFYKDGIYNEQYSQLEKEFSDEILLKSNKVKNYIKFTKLEEEYKEIIPYLLKENREKIKEIGKKLKSKQTIKKVSWGTGVIVTISLLTMGAMGWYVKTKLLKTESELFSDIKVEYEHKSYHDAMEDIAIYQKKFKDTLNIEHKNSVEEIKNKISLYYKLKFNNILNNNSLLTQYNQLTLLYAEVDDFNAVIDTSSIKHKYKEIKKLKDGYEKIVGFSIDDLTNLSEISTVLNQLFTYKFKEIESLEENFKNSVVSMANNLIDETEIDDFDKIDEILNAFTALNIDSEELVKKLIDKKNMIQINNQYQELKETINSLSYEDAILKVESDWKDRYSEDKVNIIRNILSKKFNDEVEKILKKIPISIGDIDDYNDLRIKLIKVEKLRDNTLIRKIGYKSKFTSDNNSKYKEKLLSLQAYSSLLQNGISNVKITFGTNNKENEPLGFECSSEGQIVLTVESTKYDYEDDYGSCQDLEITWNSKQIFKAGYYNIKVIEKDLIDNDHFEFKFNLTANELIKMKNREAFKLNINNAYYISFGKE